MFDVADHLDELRSHSTEWLEARRRAVVTEVRRLQSEELAIVRVLDERGRIDVSMGLDGESARTGARRWRRRVRWNRCPRSLQPPTREI
jgi:hypothetical protein